ncbi:hypothetical protein AMR72_17900 [Flavobacterium psychrophilum]|nr:hypothetical protein AMR72_17900 [Flavobacterium psychrophilum]AOE54207.1 hypothetical protein ALW18_17885 [Flavobacterium psychrophilum]
MKNILSAYYNNWYIPVLISIILGIINICIITLPYQTAFYLGLTIPFIALVTSGVIGIIKLFKKQYLHGILQLISTVLVLFIGVSFLSIYIMFYPYDYYANNLEIPKDITIEVPKDSLSDVFINPIDFKLYNRFQPGIYTYDICINSPAKGTVFLKAFEVTHEDPLSVEELKLRSAITVNLSDSIAHYRLKDDFTIYEGDWGKPYAARFEMWYKNEKTGKEKKLTQKIYKIEGWMR